MPKLTARLVYSVGIFIVISLIALGAIIGAIYFVSERGEQARRDEAKEIARQAEQTTSENEQSSDEPESSPAPTDQAQPSSEDSDDAATSGDDTAVDELSATGVGSGLYEILVVALLSLSTAVYIGSRRQPYKL